MTKEQLALAIVNALWIKGALLLRHSDELQVKFNQHCARNIVEPILERAEAEVLGIDWLSENPNDLPDER